MKEKGCGGKVLLREFKTKDEYIIFSWIQNPTLRKMIGTRGRPTKESHKKWFGNKINDKENCYRIIEYNNTAVGVVGTNDLDLYNHNAEVFIYIAVEEYRKKGIAHQVLMDFIDYLRVEDEIHKFYARVFSYNKPSIRLFEGVRFKCEGRMKDQVFVYEDNIYADLLLYGYIPL